MRPSILGFFTVGMTTLSMLSVSCVLYSAGSGVKRVLVVLSGLRWSWFCCVHEAISWKVVSSSTSTSVKLTYLDEKCFQDAKFTYCLFLCETVFLLNSDKNSTK